MPRTAGGAFFHATGRSVIPPTLMRILKVIYIHYELKNGDVEGGVAGRRDNIMIDENKMKYTEQTVLYEK